MIAAPLQNAPCLFLAEEDHAKTGSACLAVIEAENLVNLAENFLEAGFHLEDVSGLVVSEGAVSVYHFDHFDTPCRATVLIVAPHDAATFPSIAGIYQGAEWHERETRDFYGFTYTGNPNFIPLLLPDNMADVHPLAKDEAARASLAALFSTADRGRKIVKQADGFTILDAPAAEEPKAEPKKEAENRPAAPKSMPKAEITLKEDARPEPAESGPEVKPEAQAPVAEADPEPEAQPENGPSSANAGPEKAAQPKATPKITQVKKPQAKTVAAPGKKAMKPAAGKKGDGNA